MGGKPSTSRMVGGSSSDSSQQWAVNLHNRLHTMGQHNSLSWKDSVAGIKFSPIWTATCYIDGVEKGSATGATKQTARDAAAKKALDGMGKT